MMNKDLINVLLLPADCFEYSDISKTLNWLTNLLDLNTINESVKGLLQNKHSNDYIN